MSKIHTQILCKYIEHVFVDGTFFLASKDAYQIVTIRNHDLINDIFYIVIYGIYLIKQLKVILNFWIK